MQEFSSLFFFSFAYLLGRGGGKQTSHLLVHYTLNALSGLGRDKS